MLRKKEEKNNKVKDEAYYVEKLEEVRTKAKGMPLVARGESEEDGTYHIWSSGFNDEEMRNLTHGAMFSQFEEDEDEMVNGCCFMTKSGDKSPMTTKVRSILQSFNIPLQAYDSEIIAFDDTVAYFGMFVVSASNEAKKLNIQLQETQKLLDSK